MTARWERRSLKHWHMVKIHPHHPRRATGLWDLAAIHTRQRPDAASGVRTSTCFPWLYNVAVCFHRGGLEDFAPRWMRQQQLKFKDWARTLPLSLQVQTNHQYSGRNYFFWTRNSSVFAWIFIAVVCAESLHQKENETLINDTLCPLEPDWNAASSIGGQLQQRDLKVKQQIKWICLICQSVSTQCRPALTAQ